MAEQLFTTILYVDQEELFSTALEKLQACEGFSQQVQLIVVDSIPSEQVRTQCGTCPNAVYLAAEDAEMPAAYNLGLQRAEGQYIGFALASGSYSPNFYKWALHVFREETTQMASANPFCVNPDGQKVAYLGSSVPTKRNNAIDLIDEETQFQLLLQAYVFRAELLRGRSFDEALHEDALLKFLLEILLDDPSYCRMRRSVRYFYTVSREDNTSTNPLQYHLWWYGDSVNKFILPLLHSAKERFGRIPSFLQAACYYLIYEKYNCNLNDRDKGVLCTKEETDAFYHDTFRTLTLIDNAVIIREKVTPRCIANRSLRMFFLRGRTEALNRKLHVVNGGSDRFAALMAGGEDDGDYRDRVAVFGSVKRERLRINVINEEDETLYIDATVGLVDFLEPEEFRVFAVATNPDTGDNTVYEPILSTVYPLVKCFGHTFRHKYAIQFQIPSVSAKRLDIQFFFEFQGQRFPFKISFATGNSRLDGSNPDSFWMFRPRWMLRRRKDTYLLIRKVRRRTRIKRELRYDRTLFQKTADKKFFFRTLLLRWLYWLLLPFYRKKHVWVTFDKLYKAGDNGEYMYQYLRAHQPEIEPYYIIRKEAPDYNRLVKQDKKHVLVYGTLRCQLIALLSEVILDTHATVDAQYNPSTDYRAVTKDLRRGEVVCIQHGLTIQDIAQYQNRQFDNIKLYCCASPYEIANVSKPFYDFRPEQLKLTGLARYDGLVNRDQKIILITPSWRKNVVNSSVANQKKTHNNNFKNSDYFRIYNRLINDDTLINCAKKTGYRIVYLLHPAMSAQLEDFDRNDFVELVPATGDVSYETMLCESSLMVTDYSGVQFDFAYMRKPILYYHPDALPPHYGEGGIDYATQAFGPICTTHERIVDELCRAMERGCAIEPEYIRRADDFFAYDDYNNCQRIYQAVRDWQNQGKKVKKP